MMFRFVTTLFTGLIASQVAMAHPLHSQITEVEWNADSRQFEVAMKLDAAAFEDALSVRTGRRVRLESMKSADELVVDYLSDTFEIESRDTLAKGTFTWHGLELELHSVWLYFEYSPQFAVEKRSRHDGARQVPATESVAAPTQVRVRNECVVDVRPRTSHFICLRCGNLNLQGHCSRAMPWAQLEPRRASMTHVSQLVD